MNSRRWWVSAGVCLLMTASSTAAHAQVTGPINVTALPTLCPGAANAIANDGNPDTTAFECAISLVPASGGEVYIPAGEYHIARTLSVLNKPIAFRGEGQRITTLIWTGTADANGTPTGHGINFASTTGAVNHQLTVKSMSLLIQTRQGYGAAINGSWQPPANMEAQGGTSATIFDVHITHKAYPLQDGEWSTANYWGYGIRLTNAIGARIHVFNIHGWGFAGQTWSLIQIAGSSRAVSINDGDMGRAAYGIHVTGSSESVRIENVETSENLDGYFFDTSGKYHFVGNSHAFVTDNGIRFLNGSESTITDNLLFGGNHNFNGIYVHNPSSAGGGFEVRGNLVVAKDDLRPSVIMHGIRLSGNIVDSRVLGNSMNVSGNAVVFENGVTLSGIIANDPGSAFIVDPCKCNTQANNP